LEELLRGAGPPVVHGGDLDPALSARRASESLRHATVQRGKADATWFAALVAESGEPTNAVRRVFPSWRAFSEFIEHHEALVEVWAYPAAGQGPARRLTAGELTALRRERRPQPTFVTLRFAEQGSTIPARYRVEFGFQAAEAMAQTTQRYRSHRALQLAVREVLGAKNADGRADAAAQFEALERAVAAGQIEVREMPLKPLVVRNFFVAAEFDVDEAQNYTRVSRFYRESELKRRVLFDTAGQGRQVLEAGRHADGTPRVVQGFRVIGTSGEIEPVPNPILGQDILELRVVDPQQADARRWAVLEFGEPELIRQAALARFSLVNAHLEAGRKRLAVKKVNYDVIAETIVAALQISGGLYGLGFPAGDAARLAYALVMPKLLADVPSVKQLRQLFVLLTAKEQHPRLKDVEATRLTEADLRELKAAAKGVPEEAVKEFMGRVEESDLDAMLEMARMQTIDARVSYLLNTVTSAAKVSGASDRAGFLREVFNNAYFSASGEINISTILLAAFDLENLTPLSGVSLESLARGAGPAEAWLQYFTLSFDLRALINTPARLKQRTLAEKELQKPLPYAPHLGNLAAYEFRVFGFPTLIFYKRGLIEADAAAFDNDFAYGLHGTRIVEHFPTRQDMDNEIRAGRMYPLGYVRVHDGKGGWKDSNLAVFAHRIAEGRHAGRTTIVLYGRKAYEEHSLYIDRERRRFEAFERALRDGAVIRQVLESDGGNGLDTASREPVIQVGSDAGAAGYDTLLGALLELRRFRLLDRWGEEPTAAERAQRARVLEALRGREVDVDGPDPLLGVDRHLSSFIYRAKSGGQTQRVKVTRITAVDDIARDLLRSEEAMEIERLRRDVAAGRSPGVVFLNEVRTVDGRLEVGPLRQGADTRVVGAGVHGGEEALAELLGRVQRLPVTDRARLQFNRFAGTLIELDADGDGRSEPSFVTIEFPPGRVRREWTNPLSGERETHTYEDGAWVESMTDRRMLQLEYGPDGAERASRVWRNLGTRQAPARGELVEETRTTAVWLRDLSRPDLDPYAPLIEKLRVNHVTGAAARETYGLYPLPVESVDDQYITRNRYNPFGVLTSAVVLENGQTAADFDRPAAAKLTEPRAGRERYRLRSLLANAEDAWNLESAGYELPVERQDVVKGLIRTRVFNTAHGGRLSREQWQDPDPDPGSAGGASGGLGSTAAGFEYRDDVYAGLLPLRAVVKREGAAEPLRQVATAGYDPATRRLTGVETDYTGRVVTNVWDYRWESPVETSSALRRTRVAFNRDETAYQGGITTADTGEDVAAFAGTYQPGSRLWSVEQRWFWQPGMLWRVETNVLSAHGRFLEAHVGGVFETRAGYDAAGREVLRRTFRRDPATGRFDVPHCDVDDFVWLQGGRSARVRRYVEGQPYDDYRAVSDGEGRVVEDGIRELPGATLRTVLSYDGATERRRRAETLQNGQVRSVAASLEAQRQADGTLVLPVTSEPAWGLRVTNLYRALDPFGRALSTVAENGTATVVREWFPDTALARVVEVTDRHGRLQERSTTRLNAGVEDGLPVDWVTRTRVGHWGNTAISDERAVIRGTDLAWLSARPGERVFFDLRTPFDAPRYARRTAGEGGASVVVDGVLRTNVIAVHGAALREYSEPGQPGAERVLDIHTVDLRGFFLRQFTVTTYDRAGRVIEERVGKVALPSPAPTSAEALLQAAAQARAMRRFAYRYEPGWMVEEPDMQAGAALLFQANRPVRTEEAWRVNDQGWREWPSQVDASQAASESDTEALDLSRYLFRRSIRPRQLKSNPHLPGVTDVWTGWTHVELNPERAPLFEFDSIYNARGESSATVARKSTSLGLPAVKVTYRLGSGAGVAWQAPPAATGTNRIALELQGRTDWSGADFVYWFARPGAGTILGAEVEDATGRRLRVTDPGADLGPGAVSFWPLGMSRVAWVPDEIAPRRGASVERPLTMEPGVEARVLGVAVLAEAGLDVRRIRSVTLDWLAGAGGQLSVTALQSLAHGAEPVVSQPRPGYDVAAFGHSSGFETYVRTREDRSARELRLDQGWEAVVRLDDLTVATVRPRERKPVFPVAVLVDSSDPDAPRPLYALAPDDGGFIEYYKTVNLGDTQVYTVASGFDTPRLEVFRAGVLEDEVAPGTVAYGFDYNVTIPQVKSRGGFERVAANVHNRTVASAFKYGGDRFAAWLLHGDPTADALVSFNRELGRAVTQAREISRLPTVAEALLPRRGLPWGGSAEAAGPAGAAALPALAGDTLPIELDQLRMRYPQSALVPTFPDTPDEPFIDTVREAGVAQLAVRLNRASLAAELLQFYAGQSEFGRQKLLASYDARTSASLTRDPRYPRPAEAPATAAAQLAVAEAAWMLGVAAGDRNAIEFGRNLIETLLAEFREPAAGRDVARGIEELPHVQTRQVAGKTLWPAARRLRTGTNARAYLLLRRIDAVLDQQPFDGAWKLSVRDALRDQAAWLTNQILPEVARTGVVPTGLFEIQDVRGDTRALGVERWTAAADWLVFLEALDALGVPRATTRGWLENLARVHGVQVAGRWGLDWSVALRRPDAIAPELTARFARVARRLEHHAAAAYAEAQLASMAVQGRWPMAVTGGAPPASGLRTGQGWVVPAATVTVASDGGTNRAGIGGWPPALLMAIEGQDTPWPTNLTGGTALRRSSFRERDLTSFVWTAAGFYLLILVVSGFWWVLHALRRRRARATRAAGGGPLLSDPAMSRAEERWAKRVLGVRPAPRAEHSRYSNGAVEQNFHMQLRALYKLVLEWRRLENGWEEGDERLAESGADEWLNGLDEFCAVAGIYSRFVVKAGRKDGFSKADVLEENEDSNHVWSRLLMYFSEYHWGMLELLEEYKRDPQAERMKLNSQIGQLLHELGMRRREEPFDGRAAFDVPADGAALDLLVLQRPGARLAQVVDAMAEKLRIPRDHIVEFIRKFKAFKHREQLFPVHPYLVELAKILPHFVLMAVVALIWYNNRVDGLRIYPYLKEQATAFAFAASSLWWAVPIIVGFGLSVAANFLTIYRFKARKHSRARPQMVLDLTLTSFFTRPEAVLPEMKSSPWLSPAWYERCGWVLRAVGMLVLSGQLLGLETPSFATFMAVKGLFAHLLVLEAAAVLVPIAVSLLSMWLEDRCTRAPGAGAWLQFLNQLNLPATRPASLLWLSLRYHFQPSVPSGGWGPMLQAVVFYFLFAGVFFLIGGYVCKEVLAVWFLDTYQSGADWKLVLGGFLFWNTMYLLRFGLFVLFTGIGAALVTFPVKTLGAALLLALAVAGVFDPAWAEIWHPLRPVGCGVLVVVLVAMAFERRVIALARLLPWLGTRARRAQQRKDAEFERIKAERSRTFGVVYMSGDDLCFAKLTPDLLMTRLSLLRDKFDSEGSRVVLSLHGAPDDAALEQWFRELYAAEKQSDVTLWHPMQLVVSGETPRLPPDLGLNIEVADAAQRELLLKAWHIRRWLVTMMSTAGHSQDTAVNLVDIALRVEREGMAPITVFYLIQNKYDNQDNNRPSQMVYHAGELGHRNKLARLLQHVAPGCRAYNVNDWTPFGFKAGGLVGMDLVYEESLRLTNMMVLDRNANAHDLDAVFADVRTALVDPGVVIVVPGRSTTNTRTPLGQGSQSLEEGHRELTKGVMLLGGVAGESVGTGWGNLQAVYYGRVQRGLVDPAVPKLPLTSRLRRGTAFGDRFEGLIGFGPHAVGISEDIWGVTQTAHNAIALGNQVKFRQSTAVWHKIRETWSHAEWFAAFPRWSGGYLQMMLDPIMQRINDGGPLSVFAKEIRANGGRFYLSAPFALLNILIMPLAIIAGVSPFIEILVVLWNFGFIMNQVLTMHGLLAVLESAGFHRLPALAGAGVTAALSLWRPGLAWCAPLLIGAGFLTGGFIVGFGRWLYDRMRDIILFGPQLVIHALGQTVRQSLEFVLSGASVNDAKAVNIPFRAWVGPREDRPFETYQNVINMRTVVWGVGVLSVALNLFALSSLDFLNVVLLLPSLLFSVSSVIGPFILKPKAGQVWGVSIGLPKALGWAAAFMLYAVVAWMVARRGWVEWVGWALVLACFGRLAQVGLRYAGYTHRIHRQTRRIASRLASDGVSENVAQKLAQEIVRTFMGDVEKTKAALERAAVPAATMEWVVETVRGALGPLLRKPVTDLTRSRFAHNRFVSEGSRSFVLALFTFLWFFVVPVPGLLVFTAGNLFAAGDYRISISLSSVVITVAGLVAFALLAAWTGRLVEWWLRRGAGVGATVAAGLNARLRDRYQRFLEAPGGAGRMHPERLSAVYGLFTDAQTYIDQRAYAYARRTLGLIDRRLAEAEAADTGASAPGAPPTRPR
jgi:hypothetical protein